MLISVVTDCGVNLESNLVAWSDAQTPLHDLHYELTRETVSSSISLAIGAIFIPFGTCTHYTTI